MTCVHWWRIASPDGPISLGRCRKCGAEREFRNADERFTYQTVQKKHKAIISSEYGTLGPDAVEEGYRE